MKNNALAWCGSLVTILTGVLTQDMLQIILTVIGILSALFSLCVNIYSWWTRAKKDGRISEEEIKELQDIVESHTKEGDNNEPR